MFEANRKLPRLKHAEKLALVNQLALMLDTGIALDVALKAAAEQSDNVNLTVVVEDLEQRIQDGVDLSTALAFHPRTFDSIFISLVKASEKTGSLAQCLMQQADYLEQEQSQRRKTRAAMAYPSLMFAVAIVVVVILVAFVMPQFGPMFRQRGVKLPTITNWLMWLGDTVTAHWKLTIFGAVVAIIGAIYAMRSDLARPQLDMMKLHLPIWGRAFRKAVLCRSIRTLGIMMKNQVPILDSLRLCAHVSGSRPYENAWNEVADLVATGARIGDSLPKSLFPATLRQMLRAGEEAGRLPMVLDKISKQYERDVEISFKAATAMLGPLMISFMGIVVGTIAWSLLMPIFSLSSPAGL